VVKCCLIEIKAHLFIRNRSVALNKNTMKKKLLIGLLIGMMVVEVFSQSSIEIAKNGIKSTVSIIALDKYSQPLGYGSGFIIGDELVATNVHVIEGCNSAYILINGESKKYVIQGYVGIDKTNDLIIVKANGLSGNIIELEEDTLPEIGEKIYAVGNPKGLNGTFSEGIVSGIREISSNDLIQITAPISPGSSGGPVLNKTGKVIGIAFASYSDGQNLNFAIPVKYLRILKNNLSSITLLSTANPQTKESSKNTVSANIKEGVIVRNIEPTEAGVSFPMESFSIQNKLPYAIKNIKIMFLVYDNTNTIVDYDESSYCKYDPIKPFLARTLTASDGTTPELAVKSGYKVIARILDFEIVEE
jgi:S1-C subfamily serine protease